MGLPRARGSASIQPASRDDLFDGGPYVVDPEDATATFDQWFDEPRGKRPVLISDFTVYALYARDAPAVTWCANYLRHTPCGWYRGDTMTSREITTATHRGIHMATLLDRFTNQDGQAVMRLQESPNGAIVDALVAAADEEIAGTYWAGSDIPVVERDGQLWFDRLDNKTDAEIDRIEQDSRLAAARTYAAEATDEQLLAILDAPMSRRDRAAALRKLGA